MKVIRNKTIPFGKEFSAINLFGTIFTKRDCDQRLINHESIHTAQMKELLYIFFYIWYVAEWLWKLAWSGNRLAAYHAISFEREAYRNEGNPDYLQHRKRYSFLRYIRKP